MNNNVNQLKKENDERFNDDTQLKLIFYFKALNALKQISRFITVILN